MDYTAQGITALMVALVVGLGLGLLAGGVRLAVSSMTSHRRVL